jgi:hypothetical protein
MLQVSTFSDRRMYLEGGPKFPDFLRPGLAPGLFFAGGA